MSLAPFQKKKKKKKKKKISPHTQKKRMRNNKYNHQARRQQLSKCIRAAGLIALGMIVLSIQESWYYSSSPSTNFDNESANGDRATVKTYSNEEESEHQHSSFRYQFMHNHHQKNNYHHSHSSDSEDPLDLRKRLKRALTARPPAFERALMEYVEKHKSATTVSKKDSENHKYIIYVSGGNDGYGNRLPGVAMAFLWALLTDRVLLVHWRDTFPNPASWGKLFQPGLEMDVDKLRDSLSDKILQYVPVGSSASCGNSKKGSSSNNGCAMIIRDDYAKIASKELNQQYPEKVLLFKSDDYAMPLLVNNEHYKDQVKSLFNNKHANVFGHIARWLLNPSPKIQKTVDRTFESLGKYNFGMHLRMQKPMPAGGDKGVKVPEPEVFFKFARMRAEALGFPASDTVFYLASDDARARDRATEYFSRRGLTVRFMEGIKFGNDGDRTSVESLQNAIAEMRVLSMCDEIVGSYGSSFSAVAASWGAITKYDIRADGSYWNTAWNEPCWRFASRGHSTAISDAASLPYHEGCHEGMSTFKDWQKSNWNKGKGL